jgi:hypothetical protein
LVLIFRIAGFAPHNLGFKLFPQPPLSGALRFSDYDWFSFCSRSCGPHPPTRHRDDGLAGTDRRCPVPLFLQSSPSGKSILSQMPFPCLDRLAVSGLRVNARVLSVTASASDCRVQIESADDVDAALHHLRSIGIHQECAHRETSATSFHSTALHVVMAGAADLLLDLS